jgi:hypothetical protein
MNARSEWDATCHCHCAEPHVATCLSRFPNVVRVLCILPLFTPASLVAGGPKYVAGVSYFNPAVAGQPVHWAAGR